MKQLLLGIALWGVAPPAAAQKTSAPAEAQSVRSMTAAKWREDLRFMADEMKRRHKNLYHLVTPQRFAAAVADLDRRIPSLQRHEIIVGMMRIAAMVGDGHTRVDPRKDAKFGLPSLPLKLYLFDDGLYVRAAAPEHASLVGAKVETIGGASADEAIRRAAEIISRDNAMGLKLMAPVYLNMPHILHALKISRSPDAAVLTVSKGRRTWQATVPAGAVEPLWPPDTDVSLVTPEGWVDARGAAKRPMWLQEPLTYHRMIDLDEQRALYVQLNMVTDTKEQSLATLAQKIAKHVDTTNPRAVILDLRLNLGGNGNLRNSLIRRLIKAEDEDTMLFVLTQRGTFSASQFILDDLDRLSNAVFVGEPASSKPSSYGDAYRIAMPNSGISVRSSIVWWQAGQNRDPWTWVDRAAPLTFADYASGKDPALEAALTYKPRPSLGAQLVQAAKLGGIAAVREGVRAYRADPSNRYADIRLHLLRAAESLSAAKHTNEAVFVAESTANWFPKDTEAFLVLAHVAEWGGRTELAKSAAARTLELDPNNRAIRSLVEQLASK